MIVTNTVFTTMPKSLAAIAVAVLTYCKSTLKFKSFSKPSYY